MREVRLDRGPVMAGRHRGVDHVPDHAVGEFRQLDFDQRHVAGLGCVPGSIEGTMDTAVESAARQARVGESVVLSPACASFDQYNNFRQRGRHFQTLVAQLGAEQSG